MTGERTDQPAPAEAALARGGGKRRPPAGTVAISAAGAERIRLGHAWVFRPQLQRGDAADGDIVRVIDHRGRFLGMAFYSARSAIALRVLTRDEQAVGQELVHERIARALARRQRWLPRVGAFRLIHGEADGLPGTVVDVYGEHIVLQTLSAGSEKLLPVIEAALAEALTPASILLRNDPAVRRIEGLPREVRQLRGTTPARISIREGLVHMTADPWHGQKTGLFLDQRENRIAVEQMSGRQVLDCFTYEGAFALHAALWASQVLAVDISGDALVQVEAHARLNGFDHIRRLEGNAFDVLRSLAATGQRFDLVILDPPAFAKNKAALEGALRGYKEINLRAMKLVAPGGHLVTASCSYHLTELAFEMVLREAAADARRVARVLKRGGQAIDHPVLLGVPESSYLKCWVLEVE